MTTLPTKKVAIVQSNYIPWKGYFDLINLVDEFILFEIFSILQKRLAIV